MKIQTLFYFKRFVTKQLDETDQYKTKVIINQVQILTERFNKEIDKLKNNLSESEVGSFIETFKINIYNDFM